MNKKIVITGITDTLNNGCWAMAEATMNLFRQELKGRVEFFYLTDCNSKDAIRLAGENRHFFYMPWTKINIPKIRFIYSYFSAIVIFLNCLLIRHFKINIFYRKFCEILKNADLVIDLSGDSISCDYNDYSVFFQIIPLLYAHILRIPYVLYAQSIGPFKSNYLYRIVKLVLRKAPLIIAREEITISLLEQSDIRDNVKLGADSAFLLRPAKEDITKISEQHNITFSKRKYIAVSMSSLISKYFHDTSMTAELFSEIIAELLDYIIENYNLDIIFIPHVMKGTKNDIHSSYEVIEKMQHKQNAILIKETYNGAQFKAIIGECNGLITCRMHAAIAAVSQCVPTLIFAYNHKTEGILGEMLNQKDLIIDIRDISADVFKRLLYQKSRHLIEKREDIKKKLTAPIVKMQDMARDNFFLCKDLL